MQIKMNSTSSVEFIFVFYANCISINSYNTIIYEMLNIPFEEYLKIFL